MAQIQITKLVPQETLDSLRELDREMQNVTQEYINTARELAKGLKVEVKVIGDIDRLEKLNASCLERFNAANERNNTIVREKNELIAQTTNVISRELMEQERLNKVNRQAYTEHEKVNEILGDLNGKTRDQAKQIAEIEAKMDRNKKSLKEQKKLYDENKISLEEYKNAVWGLKLGNEVLAVQKSKLSQLLKNEAKEMQAADTSYEQLGQRLELLKRSYKQMTEEQRKSEEGMVLEQAIQNLDAHLKDLAADMGEFQRNVGNYAIAGQNGVVTTQSVIAALQQEAVTTQDVIDQTKILEESKQRLDKGDAAYASTVEQINAKLEENRRKLSDVSDILGKEAHTAAEAEAQNKRLHEALKHVDQNSAGAKEKMKALKEQIERNNKVIRQATGETDQLAGKLASLTGVNINFGSSLQGLQGSGNVFRVLQTNVAAFGKTLMGLLANPYVLAFLGVAGVVAGFKWWFDYNKGMIEASRLTKNFTDLSGEAADKVTANVQMIADKTGKGYKETIQAANSLVQQFGLSWDEALKLMEDGIVAGADMSGKMVDNINQFAPALRDAGVSADEFMAILSNTRNGIFNEKGIQDIVKGMNKLRSMTPQLAKALDDVGISSKQLARDMADGTITGIEGLQKVAAKLKELPENSQEAGNIMKNVFGRTAAEGGTLLIESIADVNTNLEECKDNMGELGKLNEEQMEAQKELNETLAAVFKMGGTSFEEMTTKAKTFIIRGLIDIIKKGADIVNWFVRIYNESENVRKKIALIVAVFKTLWIVVSGVFELMINGFKALGGALEGVILIMSGKFEDGWDKLKNSVIGGYDGLMSIIKTKGKEIGDTFVDEFNSAVDKRLEPVKVELDGDTSGATSGKADGNDKKTPLGGVLSDKEKKALEKAAKEELKRLRTLEESRIAIMDDGHEKEMASIRLKFQKKLDEITGNSETEKALRVQLLEQMQKELADCEDKYQKELSKINLDNALAAAKEGSEEELRLKLAKLEQEYVAETEAAKKTGADVALITEKYEKKKLKLKEDYADKWADKAMKDAAKETQNLNNEYLRQVVDLKNKYNEEQKAAGDNHKKREDAEEKFNREMERLAFEQAQQTLNAEIDMLQKILESTELSAEMREQMERELTEKQLELMDLIADRAAQVQTNVVNGSAKRREKVAEDAQKWFGYASDALNAINELSSAVFDRQIQQIEALQQANQDAAEKESERITNLVSKKVITEEEGEARKRASEAKTAKKEEELARKKAEIQKKQAKFDKANSVAQAAMATALSLIQLWAKPGWPAAIPMMAIVGALGAAQIATILATPLPQYRKGTESHPGGLAVVGDGGKREVILHNDMAWLTSDKPTVMDLPKGAAVLPSIETYASRFVKPFEALPSVERMPQARVYDDKAIQRKIDELSALMRKSIAMMHRDAADFKYELYKSRI